MELEFKSILRPGKSITAPVSIVAYNKVFGHKFRFMYATKIEVTRKGFEPTKIPKAVKRKIEIAETAVRDLENEGVPINKTTLKERIDLMINQIVWSDDKRQVSIWHGGKALMFAVPESVDTTALNKALETELTKLKPDLKGVMASFISGGQNELFGFWQAVVDGKIKVRNGKKIRPITITNKKQTLALVKEYNSNLRFADMDQKFYNGFSAWLENESGDETIRGGKQMEPNSIGKHFKEIKSILHLARKNGHEVNPYYVYFPVTRERNEVVSLSKEEILNIMNLELTGTKKDVRDIFIMACFLGARIGDFSKLTDPENYITENGIKWFTDVQGKTGAKIKVPIFPELAAFMDKFPKMPKMISEQNFRDYLREICRSEELKLTDRVTVRIRDGKPEYEKKCEVITPHSARRTFATALFYGWWAKPLPASLVMRFTGHKSEKSFMLYIGANEKALEDKTLEILDFKPKMSVA